MILEQLENILKELGIELAYQKYEGKSDEYLIFDVYDNKDSDYCDNTNLKELHYVTINYWHRSKSKIKNYSRIKKLLKNNGFFFDGMKTLSKTDGLYGKNLDFIYEGDVEE